MNRSFRAFVLTLALAGCQQTPSPAPARTTATAPSQTGRIEITVDASGYHPGSVSVQAGVPVTLVFLRTSDEGCGQQLSFPSLGIRRDLPLDTPVELTLTPERGEIAFTCGMDMLRGTVVAR